MYVCVCVSHGQSLLAKKSVERITFTDISQSAITEALKRPRQVSA